MIIANLLCANCKKINNPMVLVADAVFDGLSKYSNERKDVETTHYLLEKNNRVYVKEYETSPKLYNSKRKLITQDSEKLEYRSSKLANTFDRKMIFLYVVTNVNQKRIFVKISV